MMGSGKSSIGKKLAHALSYTFIDTDDWIVEKEGKTINELFELLGEEAFRKIENNYLKQIISKENCVISTGGGLPCHHGHMELMNKYGQTILLVADGAFLASRLKFQKDKRPLIAKLSDEELPLFLDSLLLLRNKFYQKAKFSISSIDLRATDIIKKLKEGGLDF